MDIYSIEHQSVREGGRFGPMAPYQKKLSQLGSV